MANFYASYAALVLSKADFSDGVGYSSVADDFPFALGNPVFYDNVTGVERPTGRHPVTNEPLWVIEYDRYTRTVTTHGVCGSSDGISPPYGVAPDVCSLRVDVTSAGVISDIDAAAKHIIYGVANVVGDPDDLPPALAPYYIHAIMPQAKWDEIAAGLIARGVSETKVTTWRSNNPNATPADVKAAFESFVS